MKKLSNSDKRLLIELEDKKTKKLIWGLINIFLLSWLIIPLFIGIFQIIDIIQIKKQINEIKML